MNPRSYDDPMAVEMASPYNPAVRPKVELRIIIEAGRPTKVTTTYTIEEGRTESSLRAIIDFSRVVLEGRL